MRWVITECWLTFVLHFLLKSFQLQPVSVEAVAVPENNFLDLYHSYAVHAGFKYVFPSLYASFLFNLMVCSKKLRQYGISFLWVCVYFPTFEMKVDSKILFWLKKDTANSCVAQLIFHKDVFPRSDFLGGCQGQTRGGVISWMLAGLRFCFLLESSQLQPSCVEAVVVSENNFVGPYHGYAMHLGNEYVFPSL